MKVKLLMSAPKTLKNNDLNKVNPLQNSNWKAVYQRGAQLNRYPYNEVITFYFKNKHALPLIPSALDVGCGSGVHSKFLVEQGCKVLGFDGSPESVKFAGDEFGEGNVEYLISDFDGFPFERTRYDLVIDRLSTTHSTPDTVENFYKQLKPQLNPGAKILWQGFCWNNSGRMFGEPQSDGSWNNFTEGLFVELGSTCFFKLEAVQKIFRAFTIDTLNEIAVINSKNNSRHSYWNVEVTCA